MSCCIANLSGIPRSLRSSWLVWQQTGPSKVISSPASWRDYWGALAWLPPGRVILPSLPVRVLAVPGPQPCMEQFPEPNRRRLRHQKLWGCLPTWTLQYKESFLEKQRHLIPPIFLDLLFIPKVAKAVFRVAKPLVVSKALPAAHSREVSSAPPPPGGGGPEQQVLKYQTELTSPLRRGNHLVEASRSNFPLNSLSVASRPLRAVPRMVSHPPKCARSQRRPRRPGWAPQPGHQRQPSRKLGLNCSRRTSPRSRRFVPGSSNSRREK